MNGDLPLLSNFLGRCLNPSDPTVNYAIPMAMYMSNRVAAVFSDELHLDDVTGISSTPSCPVFYNQNLMSSRCHQVTKVTSSVNTQNKTFLSLWNRQTKKSSKMPNDIDKSMENVKTS